MIPEDRLSKILELTEAKRSVSVNELVSALYVSAATVRRDLTELSRRGLIVRSFGGAVALTGAGRSIQKINPNNKNPYAKLGAAAAELIPERATVFLAGCAAVNAMMPALMNKSKLTVLTDSTEIAEALCSTVEHMTITGGKYNPSLNIFTGKQAAEHIERIHLDFAFFAFDGLTEKGMFTDYSMDKLSSYTAAMRRAANRVVLCPRDCIGRQASYDLFKLSEMHTVVTDAAGRFAGNAKLTVIEA